MKRLLVLPVFLLACAQTEAPLPALHKGGPPTVGVPANAAGGFALNVPEVSLAPGQEIASHCFIFPLELTGPSRFVAGGRLRVGPGLHHGNIFARRKSGEGVRECADRDRDHLGLAVDVMKGGTVLFGSTTQLEGEEWQSFPPGMAYDLGPSEEIVANLHFLNASNKEIVVAPQYEWYTLHEKDVTQPLAPFIWHWQSLDIAPLADTTIRGSCRFPRPMHIVYTLAHMHKRGTGLSAGFVGGPLDQQPFFESRGYDPDRGTSEVFNPAVDLSSGTGAWIQCSWHNELNTTLVFGTGENEMCDLFGYAYPPENTFTAIVAGENDCSAIAVKK